MNPEPDPKKSGPTHLYLLKHANQSIFFVFMARINRLRMPAELGGSRILKSSKEPVEASSIDGVRGGLREHKTLS
jgi:hypothetical protein